MDREDALKEEFCEEKGMVSVREKVQNERYVLCEKGVERIYYEIKIANNKVYTGDENDES